MEEYRNIGQIDLMLQNHPLKIQKHKMKTKTKNKNNLRRTAITTTILPIHQKQQQETGETENYLLTTQEQEEIQTIRITKAQVAQTTLSAQTTKIIIFTQFKSPDEKEEELKTS